MAKKATTIESAASTDFHAIATTMLAGTPYGANGQIIAGLGALISKLIAALPAILPEIQALIALFGQSETPTS